MAKEQEPIYELTEPRETQYPILLSSPHSGIAFPEEDLGILPRFRDHPQDTDHLIDQLYEFGPNMGIPLIAARFSRYVIDLNRPRLQTGLYDDGRLETGLVPNASFAQEKLYDDENLPDESEVLRRIDRYYDPYHAAVRQELLRIKAQFGIAILFDCHSIKRTVPTIQPGPFPDMILGTVDGASCHPSLETAAVDALRLTEAYQVTLNDPFRGGQITREFGQPFSGVHGLQLEMCQDLYLDDANKGIQFDEAKRQRLTKVLRSTLSQLAEAAGRLV